MGCVVNVRKLSHELGGIYTGLVNKRPFFTLLSLHRYVI